MLGWKVASNYNFNCVCVPLDMRGLDHLHLQAVVPPNCVRAHSLPPLPHIFALLVASLPPPDALKHCQVRLHVWGGVLQHRGKVGH